ncbi:MAG: hypothetical protein FWE22_07670 [Firmicutes bacterium]|nr:hypothetical protein [Bacillota bacterium]
MKSTIRQMYYGEKGSSEQIKVSKEYFNLLQKFTEYEEEFVSKIAAFPELLKLYTKLAESLENANSELFFVHYAEGFKFGFLLGLEISKDD